jgi:spore coat polysaccharide biosynthesis protein SpsF
VTVVATIEARMASRRLPGKVLLPVAGRPLLGVLIERLQAASLLDRVVVATTTQPADDAIVETARAFGADVFRGSEDDVLGRVCGALDTAGAEIAVEITGDCPLVDPRMVDACIAEFGRSGDTHQYLANTTGPVPGAPHGLDVQVFWAEALRIVDREATDAEAREHVSLPFYRPQTAARWSPRFLAFFPEELCRRVWISLDYAEDYRLIKEAYETLIADDPLFDAQAIIDFCLARPDLTTPCLRLRGLAN